MIDASYSGTEEFLSNKVFGNGVDPVNLVERYKSCSFNQLRFQKATGTGISNGVMTVSIDMSVGGAADSTVRNAVTAAIQQQFGTHPANMANHV